MGWQRKASTLVLYNWLYGAVWLVGLLSVAGEFWNGLQGANRFVDDAYYYIVPAKHYVEYGFFSLDTINETNGFHPLWMAVNVLVYKLIVGTDFTLNMQIFSIKSAEIVIFLLILLSALTMAYRVQRSGSAKDAYFAYGFFGIALAIVFTTINPLFLMGMETTLAAWLLVHVYYAVVKDHHRWLAVLLPLLFLSRLETLLFVAGPIILFYLWRGDVAWADKATIVLPLVITAVLLMLFNYTTYGFAQPISGILKSSFPVPRVQLSHLADPIVRGYLLGGHYRPLLLSPTLPAVTGLLIASVVVVLVFLKAQKRGKGENLKRLLFIVIPALLIMNLLMFQKWNKHIGAWYLVLPAVATVFSFGLALQSVAEKYRFKRVVNAAVVFVLVLSALQYVRLLPETLNRRNPAGEGALRMINQTSPETVFAGTDVGYFAFWSGRRVVNLDGLINSYEYQLFIRDKNVRKYLQGMGVRYLIVTAWADKPRYQLRDNEYMYNHRVNSKAVYGKSYVYDFYVYSYMYNTYSDHIRFTPEQEVYRSDIYSDGLNDARTLIFDLTRARSRG